MTVFGRYSTVSFVRCSGELFPADCFFHFTITQRTPPLQLSIYSEYQLIMYQTISEEMLNMFASIGYLNTLIGTRANRYRGRYKELIKQADKFFETVDNDYDFVLWIHIYDNF